MSERRRKVNHRSGRVHNPGSLIVDQTDGHLQFGLFGLIGIAPLQGDERFGGFCLVHHVLGRRVVAQEGLRKA